MMLAFVLLLAGTLGRYDAKTLRNGQAQAADSVLMRRVDSVFVAWSRTSTPGCAVGVDTGGVPLFRRAYGMANLETATPWTVGTISESGSVGKQFTATALVLLARDGVLSLDDDITRWIPEAKGVGRKITIRHLLTHTSGFPDRYLLHEAEGRPAGEVDHPNAEVLDVVSRLRNLNFDPGEDYLYSNTGFILAATIVERASGYSLQKFTDGRMFRPLGMSSTRWREDHRDVVPGRASAYSGNPVAGFRNDHPFTRVIGSGGLNTTVGDFLKWQAALQKGDAPWGAVRDSLERVGRLNDGTELTYALGLTVDRWRGLRRVSHTGSTGGYRAALYRYPDQNVAVALLCNAGAINPGDIASRVSALVLGASLAAVAAEPDAAPVDSAVLSGLAGIYRAPRTGEVMILSLREGRLADSTAGNATLTPIGSGTFKYRNSARCPARPARRPASWSGHLTRGPWNTRRWSGPGWMPRGWRPTRGITPARSSEPGIAWCSGATRFSSTRAGADPSRSGRSFATDSSWAASGSPGSPGTPGAASLVSRSGPDESGISGSTGFRPGREAP